MSKQITKTVYTFRELLDMHAAGKVSGTAIEKVRHWLREGQTGHDWWDYVYELWTSALEQIGFYIVQISFRGFWSQGDGACFTAHVDVEKLIDFLARKIAPNKAIKGQPEDFRPWLVHKMNGKPTNAEYRKLLKHVDKFDDVTVESIDSHYCHENTCRFRSAFNDEGEMVKGEWTSKTPALYELYKGFDADGERLREDLSRAIYKDLEDEHEHLTSDDSLLEFSDGNEYMFTIDGAFER